MHDMKIEIEIDDAVAEDVNRFLATAGQNQTSTHGALDMAGLVQMLLQDVGLVIRLPKSWEGQKMGELLTSHGYES